MTLSATVLEALRVMLATLEQPDGSLATSLSGDISTIVGIIAVASLAAPVAAAAAWLLTHAAGAAASRGSGATPGVIWLGGLAVGVQGTVAGVQGTRLLMHGKQRWYTTLLLVAGGVALVLGLLRHQMQMLRESLRQAELAARNADVEAGMLDAPVRTHLI